MLSFTEAARGGIQDLCKLLVQLVSSLQDFQGKIILNRIVHKIQGQARERRQRLLNRVRDKFEQRQEGQGREQSPAGEVWAPRGRRARLDPTGNTAGQASSPESVGNPTVTQNGVRVGF